VPNRQRIPLSSSSSITSTTIRSSSSSTVVARATKTIASKPSSSSSAIEKVGTQLLSFVKDKKNKAAGADTVIVPAGAESQIARRLIFSLLRAGKSVVAGECGFLSLSCIIREEAIKKSPMEYWKVEAELEKATRERGAKSSEKEKKEGRARKSLSIKFLTLTSFTTST